MLTLKQYIGLARNRQVIRGGTWQENLQVVADQMPGMSKVLVAQANRLCQGLKNEGVAASLILAKANTYLEQQQKPKRRASKNDDDGLPRVRSWPPQAAPAPGKTPARHGGD